MSYLQLIRAQSVEVFGLPTQLDSVSFPLSAIADDGQVAELARCEKAAARISGERTLLSFPTNRFAESAVDAKASAEGKGRRRSVCEPDILSLSSVGRDVSRSAEMNR